MAELANHYIYKFIDNFIDFLYNKKRKRFLKQNINLIGLRVKEFRSYRILIDLLEDGIHKDLFLAKTREELNLESFLSFLADYKPLIILEIGANIGFFVLIEKETLPSVQIIAYEPVSKNFRFLELNVKLNKLKNVCLFQKAVDIEKKFTYIKVPKEGNWASLAENVIFDNYYLEKVETESFKEVLLKYCKNKRCLIRMDIEGFEYELLLSCHNILMSLKNIALVFEFHPHIIGVDKSIKMISSLKELGFKLSKLVYDVPIIYSFLPNILKRIFLNYYSPCKEIKNINTWSDFEHWLRSKKHSLRALHIYATK